MTFFFALNQDHDRQIFTQKTLNSCITRISNCYIFLVNDILSTFVQQTVLQKAQYIFPNIKRNWLNNCHNLLCHKSKEVCAAYKYKIFVSCTGKCWARLHIQPWITHYSVHVIAKFTFSTWYKILDKINFFLLLLAGVSVIWKYILAFNTISLSLFSLYILCT